MFDFVNNLKINRLQKKLENGDCTAAIALGETGDSRAVELLIKALDHWKIEVKEHAVKALGKIGDQRAIEPLIRMDPKSIIRTIAASLEKIGEPAMEVLIQELKTNNSTKRKHAALLLTTIGWKPSNQAEEISYLIASAQWDKLVKVCNPAVPFLISQLSTNIDKSRIIDTLGEIGDPRAVDSLVDALKDKYNYSAVSALIRIGDARAYAPLSTVLKEELKNKATRTYAATSLDKIGWKPSSTNEHCYLLVGLQKWEALTELGSSAVESLINMFEDSDEQDKIADVLGRIGDTRAVEPLIKSFSAPNSRLWESSARALGLIGDVSVLDQLIRMLKTDKRHGAILALGEMGNALAVEPLLELLADQNSGIRWRVADALGKIGDAGAIEPLITLLKDKDTSGTVQKCAMNALVKIGKPAVEPLLSDLSDTDYFLVDYEDYAIKRYIRELKIQALGEIGDPRAIAPLTEALSDSNKKVQSAAKQALDGIRSKTL